MCILKFSSIIILILLNILFADAIRLAAEDRCPIYQFRCNNAKCIPITLKCNGNDDCGDLSDEHCIDENIFKCNNSMMITKDKLCDGVNDCDDDEDRRNCEEYKCSKDNFLCRTKIMKCINMKAVCNNINDCTDNYDESPDACEYIRQSKIVQCDNSTQFRCTNKELCISKLYRCDGNYDCKDKSDELGCAVVPRNNATLYNETKIVLSYINECSTNDFYCGEESPQKCIPIEWVCDSSFDCEVTNRDEINCPNFKCPTYKPLKCKDNDICYETEKLCDGSQNCPDQSDEANCPKQKHSVICNSFTEFNCFKKNICIPLSKVCDKNNDCGDGSDERPGGQEINCKKTPCKINNGGCEQECGSFYFERKCFCRPGYEISSEDNTKCVDIDECARGMACSHTCKNTLGSYECKCFDGFYQSKSNVTQCVAVGEKFLLFSSKNSIRELRLLHHHMEEITGTNDNNKKLQVIGLDFDYKSGSIFWTQFEPIPAIVKIKPNSLKDDLVVKRIHSPVGIAYDWIHGLLFWTDSFYKEISVINVINGHRRVLHKVNNDSKLRAIVVHPKFRKVYWSDWGNNPRIMSMGMDGNDKKTIVKDGLMTPNGLAMDYYLNELYWVDSRARNIKSYHLKTGKQREVASHLDCHGFSLDVFEDWLYLSDWRNQNILQIHKITGEQKVLISTPKPLCLKIMHQLAQPENIENVCYNNPCEMMCLPLALNLKNDLKYHCQCADGSELMKDNKRCTNNIKNNRKFITNNSTTGYASLSHKIPENVLYKTSIFLVVGFVSAVVVLVFATVVFLGVLMFRNYNKKVIKRTTKFDNPVYYRKTSTHDLQMLNAGNYAMIENLHNGLINNED